MPNPVTDNLVAFNVHGVHGSEVNRPESEC